MTTFTAGPQVQTLPLWIFQNLFRPNQAPIVNVVAAVLVLVSAVPIYLAQRLSGDTVSTATATPVQSAERVGEQPQGGLARRGLAGRRTGEGAGDRVQHHLVDVVRRGELGHLLGGLVRRTDHPALEHLLGEGAVLLGQAALLGLLDEGLRGERARRCGG